MVLAAAVVVSGALPASGPSVVSAAPGSVSVSITGPTEITIPFDTAPKRFEYMVTLTYQGPPITENTQTRWTVHTPQLVTNIGIGTVQQGNIFDCAFSPSGEPAPSVSCTADFLESRRTVAFPVGVRPTGEVGTGTATLEVATGATSTWSTTFTRAPLPPVPPPPPSPPPAPLPGPAAAPTQTVTETFTKPREVQPESVSVAPTAQTVQVALTWSDSDSSFDVAGVRLASATRLLAATTPRSAERLRITKRRGSTSLDVRIRGVKRGKLRFEIVAKQLDGRARVKAKIRQSKR